jgi:hypothetical protein
MKKLMLSLGAMGFLAFATVQAQTPALPNQEGIEQQEVMEQETTKIDPESLPEKVKEAIQGNDEVKELKISEAHHVMEENQAFYVVKFEGTGEGEEVKKKFDVMGKEVKEADPAI